MFIYVNQALFFYIQHISSILKIIKYFYASSNQAYYCNQFNHIKSSYIISIFGRCTSNRWKSQKWA